MEMADLGSIASNSSSACSDSGSGRKTLFGGPTVPNRPTRPVSLQYDVVGNETVHDTDTADEAGFHSTHSLGESESTGAAREAPAAVRSASKALRDAAGTVTPVLILY